MLSKLSSSIVDLDVTNIGTITREALQSHSADQVLAALSEGMNKVGEGYERGECFLSDLIMAGETMNEAVGILTPHLGHDRIWKGRIVLGTIEGDLHDIGKNIASTLLEAAGLAVYDLGIDVPPKRFVEEALKRNADVVGVSALLTVSVPNTARVVSGLRGTGRGQRVKTIVGGAAATKEHVKKYGLDASVNDVVEGMKIIESWVKTD